MKKIKEPCYMCDSARVSPDLKDGYDFSSISVGVTYDRERFMLESGNRSAVALRFEKFNDQYGKWYSCGSYYPKYCPNCGRELSEYIVNDRGSKFSNREEE